jgi:hypothetical protein
MIGVENRKIEALDLQERKESPICKERFDSQTCNLSKDFSVFVVDISFQRSTDYENDGRGSTARIENSHLLFHLPQERI